MRKLVIGSVCMMFVSCVAMADSVTFAAGTWTTPAISSPYCKLRDGSHALSNVCLVIGIATPNAAGLPPTTNDVAGYIDKAQSEYYFTTPAYRGTVRARNNVTGGRVVPCDAGEYLLSVACNPGHRAYARVYSDMLETNAAYYVNTAAILGAITPPTAADGGTVCSNINPCYKQLAFDVRPVKYVSGSANCLSGSVNTVAGGTNNVLDNAAVMVYWRTNSAYQWEALLNFAIFGDGDFTGTYAGGSEVMVGMTAGPNAMPNSMLIGAQGPIILDTLTLEAARAKGTGVFVSVDKVTISTTNDLAAGRYSFPVEDGTAGVMLSDPSAAYIYNLIVSNNLKPNDRLLISGTNEINNGVYQLGGVTIGTNYGPAAALAPIAISIQDLQNGAANAEKYESMYVVISNVVFTNATTFAAGVSYAISNDSFCAVVRINDPADPLVGTAAPVGPCHLYGILSQDDPNPPYITNYMILPLRWKQAPVGTNVVQMMPGPASGIVNKPVPFMTRSWSNGIAQIGYGSSQDGSGWTWMNAAVTNASSPYVAVSNVFFPAPGTYFYAARWTVGPSNYYGLNSTGQTNLYALGMAQYSISIAMASNTVYLLPTVGTTIVNTAVSFDTRSISNGTARILYSTSQAGPWTIASAAAVTNAASPFIAVTNVSFATTGTYYYIAEWNVDGTNYYGWNTTGQINQYSPQAEYGIVVNPAAILTNVVRMLKAIATTSVHCRVTFRSASLSNETAQFGYGRNQDGSDWTWNPGFADGTTNISAGVTNFLARSANLLFDNAGRFYYATRWTNAAYHFYGINDKGQTNRYALGQAEYFIDISLPLTNVVAVMRAALTTAPNALVSFETTSISNGSAAIGFGTSSNGAGWTWVAVPVSNNVVAEPLYFASTNLAFATTGSYYYGARWTVGIDNFFGWNQNGQTNMSITNSQYSVLVTLGLVPIAEARSFGRYANVQVGPFTLSTTNKLAPSGNYMFCGQDADGVSLYGTSAQMASLISGSNLKPGDRIAVRGSNVWDKGLYKLMGLSIVSNYGNVGLPPVHDISFADLQDNAPTGQICQSMRVVFRGVWFTNTGNFAYGDYTVNDGWGAQAVVSVASQTDPLVGIPITNDVPYDVVGIMSQVDTNIPPPMVGGGGYRVILLEVYPVPEPAALLAGLIGVVVFLRRRTAR